MNNSVEIVAGIVCEDIRIERNGKYMLIGCYGSGVLLPSLPAPLNVSFAGIVNISGFGPQRVDLRVVDDEGLQLAAVAFDLPDVRPELGAIMPIGPFHMNLTKIGNLHFQQFWNGIWRTVRTFGLAVAAGPPTI